MKAPALVKGRYGIDAPYVPFAQGGCGLALAAVAFAVFAHRAVPMGFAIAAAVLLASTASYMYTTLHGKFHTGDMRTLPFPDGAFDLVVSSVAIHNIPDASGREKAIDEAVRVLKRAGRVGIADFRHVDDYAARLRGLGMLEVNERSLGYRFWYGGPWAATRLVTAKKA